VGGDQVHCQVVFLDLYAQGSPPHAPEGFSPITFSQVVDVEGRWEWLQLLGALTILEDLAAAGISFTVQQDQRQQQIEDQHAKQAQKIEI
jgi:hypothetical protein